jgi:hypothetical protein
MDTIKQKKLVEVKTTLEQCYQTLERLHVELKGSEEFIEFSAVLGCVQSLLVDSIVIIEDAESTEGTK